MRQDVRLKLRCHDLKSHATRFSLLQEHLPGANLMGARRMLLSLLVLGLMVLSPLGLTGCGALLGNSSHAQPVFSIHASATTVATTDEVRLTALMADGSPAQVEWSIAGGDNRSSLGQGRIESDGLYIPPNSLSSNTITVNVRATLGTDPGKSRTLPVTIHPSFVEPLMPEVATLSVGSAIYARAVITEINAGTVRWSLASTPDFPNKLSASPSNSLGKLSMSRCAYKSQQYTACTVLYTTPAHLPVGDAVYLVATINDTGKTATSKILLNDHRLNSTPAANQAIQHGEALLGSSGGNDDDYDIYTAPSGQRYIADCCGGTLGALVEDAQGQRYLLSNNHVLAESDQASAGNAIVQPGLIDGACTPLSDPDSLLHAVGKLRTWVRLASHQTNVDAALASILPGQINTQGAILALGPLRQGLLTAAPPTAGSGEVLMPENLRMAVVKSGRTTGLTCSHLGAIDLSVKVNYYRDCAETQPYLTKIFRHQIAIAGAHFTDSGDSGALVLDASNARAIGLYFAGGSNQQGQALSLVNPMHDVLGELSQALGSPLTLVGSKAPHSVTCIDYSDATEISAPQIPFAWQERVEKTTATPAFAAWAKELGTGTVLGTATGASLDEPGTPALIVYIDAAHTSLTIPAIFDGLRTQVIVTSAAALAQGTAPKRPQPEVGLTLSAAAIAQAEEAVRALAPRLLENPAILGVGVTESLDQPGEPALLILVRLNRHLRPRPVVLDGLRVRYLALEGFHITRARMFENPPPTRCAIAGADRNYGKTFWNEPR